MADCFARYGKNDGAEVDTSALFMPVAELLKQMIIIIDKGTWLCYNIIEDKIV